MKKTIPILFAVACVMLLSARVLLSEPMAPETLGVAYQDYMEQAHDLETRGKLGEAKEVYQKLLTFNHEPELKTKIRHELESLNLKILFSTAPMPDSFLYKVKSGDSLFKIAKKHNTTIGLLRRSNFIKGDKIFPGTKLKVVTGKFSILVNRGENRLYLLYNDEVFTSYPVATGKTMNTPLGDFTIVTKLENPTWYTSGAVIPPESEENILGTRWLGFSIDGFGIHGTTIPESIGTFSTAGCVRMLNANVEELYDIVPLNSEVTIVE